MATIGRLLAITLLAALVAPHAAAQTAPSAAAPAAALGSLGRATQLVIPSARSFALDARRCGVEIESVRAEVSILEQAARTTLEIVLRNTSGRAEQAVLLLPVPDGAAVGAFAFDGVGGEPSAQVLTRDEARRLYDAIVAKLLDPALLEFAGYDLVRTSVFPVPPGGTQRVRLTYEHLLEADGDRVDYVLPRSESLERRCPWSIDVRIASSHPISTAYSPSHAIVTERLAEGKLAVRVADGAGMEPGPFRLSYLHDRGGGVAASLFAYPDPEIGGGYFLLMAGLPAAPSSAGSKAPRAVTLVLDRSGSMAGDKLDQARAAALGVIDAIDDGESFNVIDYASGVAAFASAPVVKDRRAAAEAHRYLASIRPGGGTNIHDALLEALRQPRAPGTRPIVLFLTDGLPTIGRTSEVEIRNMVESFTAPTSRQHLDAPTRCPPLHPHHGAPLIPSLPLSLIASPPSPSPPSIFTFGVGDDVNAPLLDRVAQITGGTSTYVLPGEDVEVKVAQVFRHLSGPVLSNAMLYTTGGDGAVSTRLVRDLEPAEPPALFDGDQLILLGRYLDDGPITFHLRGRFLGEAREFTYTFDPGRRATTRHAFVPRLWASRRIARLVDEIRQAGAPSAESETRPLLDDPRYVETIDEIIRLSMRFGVLTEYTAFLATEGTNLADGTGLRERCSAHLDEKAVKTRSGRAAVVQAMNWRLQRDQSALNHDNRFYDERLRPVDFTAVRQVCDRAFFRRGGRWIDSRLAAIWDEVQPARVVVLGSEAHRELMRELVEEGRQGVMALQGEVLLLVGGEIVLVKDGC